MATTPFVAPPRRSAWWQASAVLIAELVGTGVLGLPYTLNILGLAPGLAVLIIFAFFAYYSGILLWRLHHVYPTAITYPDLASNFGRSMRRIVFVFLYIAVSIDVYTC